MGGVGRRPRRRRPGNRCRRRAAGSLRSSAPAARHRAEGAAATVRRTGRAPAASGSDLGTPDRTRRHPRSRPGNCRSGPDPAGPHPAAPREGGGAARRRHRARVRGGPGLRIGDGRTRGGSADPPVGRCPSTDGPVRCGHPAGREDFPYRPGGRTRRHDPRNAHRRGAAAGPRLAGPAADRPRVRELRGGGHGARGAGLSSAAAGDRRRADSRRPRARYLSRSAEETRAAPADPRS